MCKLLIFLLSPNKIGAIFCYLIYLNGQKGGDQYIRNQNVLSDWEDITISTDSNNPTVMPYDGFFTFLMPMGTVGILNINEVAIFQDLKRDGSWSVSSSVTVPFKEGNNLYYSRLNATPLVSKVAYYKNRDYTGR